MQESKEGWQTGGTPVIGSRGSDVLEVMTCLDLKAVEDAAGRSVIGSSACLRRRGVCDGISYDPYGFEFFEVPDSGISTTITFISLFFANSINLP